jgi:hypothetical protein
MNYEAAMEDQHYEHTHTPSSPADVLQTLIATVQNLGRAVEVMTNRLETVTANQVEQQQQTATIIQQQQAIRQAAEDDTAAITTAAQVLQETRAPPVTATKLPSFKIPSAQPPSFSGNVRSKSAHEAQAVIDEYLHKAEAVADLYKFRGDGETETFQGQPTYVSWISIGLTGLALSYWRRVPLAERKAMSWAQYKKWIHNNFTSKLTLQEAIDTMDTIKQKGSAAQYSETFNELVEAIRSANVEYQQEHLCVKYRKGLKDHLRTNETLFKISDDLAALQRETERLDDFHWRSNKENRTSNKNSNSKPSFRYQSFRNPTSPTLKQKDDPMDLDNVETRHKRLTDQEKAIYRANGWCTFCRSQGHNYAQCNAPGKKNRFPNPNNITTSTKKLNNVNTVGGSSRESQTDDDE